MNLRGVFAIQFYSRLFDQVLLRCALTLGLTLGLVLGFSQSAQAQEAALWELRPTRIDVLLAPDPAPVWTAERLAQLQAAARNAVRAWYGKAWDARISLAPPAVRGLALAPAAEPLSSLADARWPAIEWAPGASSLDEQDILDWPGLLKKLAAASAGSADPPVMRCYERWSLLDPQAATLAKTAPEKLNPPLKGQLLRSWNQVFDQADFYVPAAWQALRLDEQLQKRLAVPAAARTAWTTRLTNRLLWEAAFPRELAKTASADAILVVALHAEPGAWRVAARAWESESATWGPVVARSTSLLDGLSDEVAACVIQAGPSAAKVASVVDGKIRLQPRGAGLPTRETRGAAGRIGSVWRLVQRGTASSAGHALPGVLLQVEAFDGREATARVVSGFAHPLALLQDTPGNWVALQMMPGGAGTWVRLLSPDQPPRPWTGLEVIASGNEKQEALGRTDAQGRIFVPRGKGVLRLLDIRSGSGLLARTPLVPGYQSEEVVILSDPPGRRATEAAAAELEAQFLEAVARQEILATEVAALVRADRSAEAETLVAALKTVQTEEKKKLEAAIQEQKKRLATLGAVQADAVLGPFTEGLAKLFPANRVEELAKTLKPKEAPKPTETVPPGWERIVSAEGKFTALLPIGSEQETRPLPSPTGEVKITMWSAKEPNKNIQCAIFYYLLPAGNMPPVESTLQQSLSLMVQRFQATLDGQKNLTVDGRPALEGTGFYGNQRFVSRGQTLDGRGYQQIVFGDEASVQSAEAQRFLDSLKLGPPPAN